MLIINLYWFKIFSFCSLYFNTSNVNNKQRYFENDGKFKPNFNTSNVNNKRALVGRLLLPHIHFNTSNVNNKPK